MNYSPSSKTHNLLNRSRSSSCSSPVRNRICYQEVICNGDDTLFRSLSCDQFSRKDSSGQTQVWNQFQVYNFITPTKKLEENKGINKKVWSVPKRLAIDFPEKKSNLKARTSLKYLESEDSVTESKINNNNNNHKINFRKKKFIRKTTMLLAATISAIAVGYFFYRTPHKCTYEWIPEYKHMVFRELSDSVFGQDEAIVKMRDLWNSYSWTNKKTLVLTFTGGVGVGKTYASSIINSFYPWKSHNHISLKNYLISQEELTYLDWWNISSCGGHLIIIDDISILDSTKAIMLASELTNIIKLDGKLLIILIFSTQNKEQENLVVSQIEKIENFHHIPFKSLGRADIEKCFMKEIRRQNVVISKDKINELVEEQLSYIDVLKGPPGCKGISDQVSKFYL